MKRSVTELLDPDIVSQADAEFPDVPTIGMPLTETGNAERMVARFRNRIRYCPPRRKWLIWDGRRWAWDDRGRTGQRATMSFSRAIATQLHGVAARVAETAAKDVARAMTASAKSAFDCETFDSFMEKAPDELATRVATMLDAAVAAVTQERLQEYDDHPTE